VRPERRQWKEERRVGTGHWSEAEARSNCVVIDDGGADGSRIVAGCRTLLGIRTRLDDKTDVIGRSEQRRVECGWDVWSGREAAKLEGRTEPVTSVVMSADGSRIVGGSRDNTI